MSLDNAAIETLPDNCVECEKDDIFSAMSDRELAEFNARTLSEIVTKVNGIVDSVAPAMERLQKHPLLGGLFR